MYKKALFILLLLCLLFAPGSVFAEVTLRAKLPADTVGYIRIPSPWGFFTHPKNNVLKDALGNDEHVRQLNKVEASIHKNILQKAEPFVGPLPTLLLHQLRSPIEVVFLLPENAPAPIPNALVSATLNIDSIEALNALLKTLADQAPLLAILSEVAVDGYGVLMLEHNPIFLHYDPTSHNLSLMFGITADKQLFQKTLSELAPVATHPMYPLEDQIDASRQGLFLWLNAQRLLPLLQSGMSTAERRDLQRLGLMSTRALALGWGTNKSKGRLKFIIDAPKDGYRAFIPDVSNTLTLAASGKPGTVFMYSMPPLELLQGIDALLSKEATPDEIRDYQSFKADFQEQMGMPLEDFLSAFGSEMIFFTDEVGEYLALRVKDSQQIQRIVKILVSQFNLNYEVKQLHGKAHHHLAIPPLLPMEEDAAAGMDDEAMGFFLTLLGRSRSHLYWIEESDYLIFAQVPQLLMDRQRFQGAATPIQQWLSEQQGQDSRAAMLLLSTTIADTPRHIYYAYLQILNALADVAQESFDLYALPTAMDLRLPAEGTYGVQLDLADSLMALEFTFENNPLEFLLGQDMSAIAVLGILSAVAIPAYQDYTIRAQVTEGLALASTLKIAVAEFYYSEGAVPEDLEEIGYAEADLSGSYTEFIDMENGVIIITYGNAADWAISGEILTLTPYESKDRGSILWRCGWAPEPDAQSFAPLGTQTDQPVEYQLPSLDIKYMPAECRP